MDNKGKLAQVATYLKENRDAVSEVTSKPIEELMNDAGEVCTLANECGKVQDKSKYNGMI